MVCRVVGNAGAFPCFVPAQRNRNIDFDDWKQALQEVVPCHDSLLRPGPACINLQFFRNAQCSLTLIRREIRAENELFRIGNMTVDMSKLLVTDSLSNPHNRLHERQISHRRARSVLQAQRSRPLLHVRSVLSFRRQQHSIAWLTFRLRIPQQGNCKMSCHLK